MLTDSDVSHVVSVYKDVEPVLTDEEKLKDAIQTLRLIVASEPDLREVMMTHRKRRKLFSIASIDISLARQCLFRIDKDWRTPK